MANGLDAALTTERVSFSAGSGDGTLAIMGRMRREAQRNQSSFDGGGFELSLNPGDAGTLAEALAFLAYETGVDGLSEWAADMLSTLGQTVNVELI